MINQQAYNKKLIAEFRATRGNPDWPFANRPLLLLTTRGAKTGQPHTIPMMFIADGTDWLIIASNAGAANHPDWYYNLLSDPFVTVELGTETLGATAHVISGAERQALWAQIMAQYPFFAAHQAKTTREIPVIRLQRSLE